MPWVSCLPEFTGVRSRALRDETRQNHFLRWQVFSDWCQARGDSNCPTSAETAVAAMQDIRREMSGHSQRPVDAGTGSPASGGFAAPLGNAREQDADLEQQPGR